MIKTYYRVDSRPHGNDWDEGAGYTSKAVAQAELGRLTRQLPSWDFRLVRVREDFLMSSRARRNPPA